ncbi:LysR family transcriptional regulator [Rhodoplanes sp. TEM]|uniref:LysR family transcriptional regulator n=1 Tax=Rhodoplanes tepidamans TaxID=200616 RepID=A0ABT5J4L1_RHOTP|nr:MULTISPECIES: LysR family transcriptional regulator [Rhodoplanes]MDC7784574.1 LysR family transcriptional regulator [Rhodoplanes tepidamans]MDC7984481.1 LysR family transcriptional regulator [Rhodoplanes sp. TEM]MDQ0355802.1 DNA-binding transcriptional LysR family regulator [Rhodoplanes tepidamans]
MAFDGRLLGSIGVLAAVVETGNFVRAADSLGLTPSGVSRAVARLEQRIGIRLLDRTPRAVTLTDEGRRFHARVMPLLAELEEATADAGGAAGTVRGRLRVNVDPWFARFVLAPRLADLLAAHPGLTIELMVRDTLGDLVADGFDVAVRFGVPEPSGLIVRKLLDTRIITCAAPAYLARRGVPAHPRDLAGHDCLLFRDPRTGRPFGWEFHRAGEIVTVPVEGRLVVNDLATKLAACAAGHGVAQTFALGMDSLLAAGTLVQILPEWTDEVFPLYAVHPSRRLPPAKVRAFVDFVVASLAVPGPGDR